MMSEHTMDPTPMHHKRHLNETAGKWLGALGLIIGVIGWFWQPLWLGIAAVVFGIVGLFSDQKVLNWTAIIAGAIALIVAWVTMV